MLSAQAERVRIPSQTWVKSTLTIYGAGKSGQNRSRTSRGLRSDVHYWRKSGCLLPSAPPKISKKPIDKRPQVCYNISTAREKGSDSMTFETWTTTDNQTNDPFNMAHTRNIRNTNKRSYNCGGYALGIFSWYCPYKENDPMMSKFACGYRTKKAGQKLTDYAITVMLEEFPTMRVVESLEEIQSDEYAILFRCSSTGDFHYIKRDKGNHWRHKRGGFSKIETMKAKHAFDVWCDKYDGPIVIFAKKL